MASNHEESFCCGAGGGRMWMEENLGSRMNVTRVKQAAETGAETVCVSCPYCMTMFEDGMKDIESDMKVRDIAELVAERIAEA
jgi:Fe-S oxidoreductase